MAGENLTASQPNNQFHPILAGGMKIQQLRLVETWWDERVEAVNRIVEAVFAEPDEEDKEENRQSAEGPPRRRNGQTVGTLLGTPGCLTYQNRMQVIDSILMVGERGFEPPTPWSRTRCSTRLSHSPNICCSMRISGCGLAQ